MALALSFLLPRLAAGIVRAAIESGSAGDRAAYAAGGSPWQWHFREARDVVAGRAFGGATLATDDDGLILRGTDGSAAEVGFPLARTADLRRMDSLRLDVATSGPVRMGLSVREALDEPMRHADVGEWPAGALDRAVPLSRLAWRDDTGRAVPAPTRAAMLRLAVTQPAGQTFVLRDASLSPSTEPVLPPSGALPRGLAAEALLAWRDNLRAAEPLVVFGERAAKAAPARWPWLAVGAYAAMLVGALVRFRRRADDRNAAPSPAAPRYGRIADVTRALLVVAGPLAFIAGLGLDNRPAVSAILLFVLGVAYAGYLAARGALPGWRWLKWSHAGWPFLAVLAAAVLVASFGHRLAWPPASRALIYLGWACFQQWLVLAVAGALLDRALPRPWAVVATALVFALLHTPNGLLMQLCFLAELGWAWWFFRHRALLPIAAAHAASALIVQAGLAGGLLRSLEVSARFLN